MRFARDWLAVLTSDVSIALNRMAISQAGSATSDLGSIVLQNGPFAMRRRLLPLLVMGRDAGYLEFTNGAEAFMLLFRTGCPGYSNSGFVGRRRIARYSSNNQGSRKGDPSIFCPLWEEINQVKGYSNAGLL